MVHLKIKIGRCTTYLFRNDVIDMSGTASIVVGILMIFLFGIGYIVGRCVAYDEKDN